MYPVIGLEKNKHTNSDYTFLLTHYTLPTQMRDRAEEKTATELHIEQLFKNMLPREDAPEAVKKEVFQTLDTLNLVGDVFDLFTAKFTQSESEFLDLLAEEDEVN